MAQSASSMQAAVQQQQQQQQQRSSQSSSHDQQYYQQQHANKSRNVTNPTQPIPDMQRQTMKQEQRQHVKDQQQQQPQQPKPIDPTKNQIKQQQQQQHSSSSGNSSGSLYPSNENQQRISGTSRQPPYQQQLPNYNQAMASRKINHPQQQQQQQHHVQPEHTSVHQMKQPMSESAFRLTDDQSGPIAENSELNSPPKPHKSIFSPEWNDSVNVVPPPQRTVNNGLNIKTNRDSPKKHRSDTPKKDKRNDLMNPQLGNKVVPSHSDKRGNGAAKRLPDTPGMSVSQQQNLPYDSTSTIAKHLNAGVKRLLPDDMIKQENGIDFREAKHRKLDVHQPLSPSLSLDCKPNLSKLSIYPSENAPSTIYDNPMKTTSFNGIETNPDLVSSLLKESLATDTKFHSSLSTVPHEMQQQSMVKQEPSKYDAYEPSATLPQQLFETSLPAQIKLEPGSELGQRIKTEKKKKKDKHKHKDKDKTKDREERKKHKKDKDRQKDRERSTELPPADGHNPLKITIPRDKLISSQDVTQPGGGFKITIPRDRIKPEPLPQQQQQQPPASLKIKISKDLIENYASGQPHNPAETNSNSHSHSSKKKDKDRDREKSKSSKHSDFTKQNGNNSNGSNGGTATATGANNASGRNQSSNSNKVCVRSNNIIAVVVV